jgi:hypothetical protein
MPSSSTQNTTIYSPSIVLQQNPTRTVVTINTNALSGVTIYSGITTGDAIRYDPLISGYTLCNGTTEVGSQVLGIVESISSNLYTVVTSGSVVYPAARLAGITYGGDGGVDILYLDENVPGGLTGAVIVTVSSGEKIVKPVIQIAPHGSYTGIVINSLGYKSGYEPTTVEEGVVLGPGAIVFGIKGIPPGPNWFDVSEGLTASTSTYPDLYTVYQGKTDFIETIKLFGSSVSAGLIGKQAYQLSGTDKVRTGTVIDCDITPTQNSLDIKKTVGTLQMDPTAVVYVETDTNLFGITSTVISKFILPPVSGAATQTGISLSPYIKAYESIKTFVPTTMQVSKFIATDNAQIGIYPDVELALDDIYTKLGLLNTRLGGGLF